MDDGDISASHAIDIALKLESHAINVRQGVVQRYPRDPFVIGDIVVANTALYPSASGPAPESAMAVVTAVRGASVSLVMMQSQEQAVIVDEKAFGLRHADELELHAVRIDPIMRDAAVAERFRSGPNPSHVVTVAAYRGQYSGPIVAISDTHAYQNVGRGSISKHELEQLPFIPWMDDAKREIQITYVNGVGQIEDLRARELLENEVSR